MLDEIRHYCALLLSEDFGVHSAAYHWLQDCQVFGQVVERFCHLEMNVFDVAALLSPNSNRPLSAAAVGALVEELTAQTASRRRRRWASAVGV
jgi:hypothetical protein